MSAKTADQTLKYDHFHVVDSDYSIQQMMTNEGYQHNGQNYLRNAGIVVFPGGADVNPELYKEGVHPTTRFNEKLDNRWQSVWGHLKSSNILKIGICRGAQFLNVVNGGGMWQDVSGHALNGTHGCFYNSNTGKIYLFDVTSTHHQMMIPVWQRAKIWGWTRLSRHRDKWMDRQRPTNFLEDGPDMEIVWYPETSCLCFQPHPEYGDDDCRKLFFICVRRALRLMKG